MTKVKRFAVFAWESYEALGGWGDFIGSFDTIEEVVEKQKENEHRCCEVVDLELGKEVL